MIMHPFHAQESARPTGIENLLISGLPISTFFRFFRRIKSLLTFNLPVIRSSLEYWIELPHFPESSCRPLAETCTKGLCAAGRPNKRDQSYLYTQL